MICCDQSILFLIDTLCSLFFLMAFKCFTLGFKNGVFWITIDIISVRVPDLPEGSFEADWPKVASFGYQVELLLNFIFHGDYLLL